MTHPVGPSRRVPNLGHLDHHSRAPEAGLDYDELQDLVGHLTFGVAAYRAESDDPGDLRLVYANAAATDQTETDLGQSIGRPLREIFPFALHGLPGESVASIMLRVAKGDDAQLIETVAHNDEKMPDSLFRIHVTPGKSDLVIVAFEKTTTGEWAAAALQRTQDELQRFHRSTYEDLYENAPDMMVSVNAKTGNLEQCNMTAAKKLGYTKEEMLRHSVFEFYHPDCMDGVKAAFKSFVETGEVHNAELELKRKDGTKIPVMLSVSATRDKDGHVLHSRSVWRDITDLKQAESTRTKLEEYKRRLRLEAKREKEQRLQSLGVLAGGMAHDFNNLLTSVMGNASLALMELPPTSPLRSAMKAIEDSASHGAALVQQMLAYAGEGQVSPESVDVSALIAESKPLLAIAVSQKVVVSYSLHRGLPPITVDRTQLKQIVVNLMTNASEAMGDTGGAVTVTTGILTPGADDSVSVLQGEIPDGAYVYIEVSDTGSGMDETTQAKMWDPFFTTKFTGRGLGLASVQGIVRGQGGTTRVVSRPGGGTKIQILFATTGHGL